MYACCIHSNALQYRQSKFIMETNTVNADQTALTGECLSWVHIVCKIGYTEERVDNNCCYVIAGKVLKNRFQPLYTNGFFLLVWYNKLGIVHCIYLGVSCYNFQKYCILLSEDHIYLYKQFAVTLEGNVNNLKPIHNCTGFIFCTFYTHFT